MSAIGCLLGSCSQGSFLKTAVPLDAPKRSYYVHAELRGLLATLPLDTFPETWPDMPYLPQSTLCHCYSLGT